MRHCKTCGAELTTTRGPRTCPACKRANYLAVKRRYQQSAKGQATTRAREERADVREKRREAAASQQHRGVDKKYRATPKGRATSAKRGANYRARRKQAEGTLSAQDWIDLVERHKHRCYYCKKRKLRLTLDHVIPLSKGGRNSIENVVPACQSCNCRKRDRIYLLA